MAKAKSKMKAMAQKYTARGASSTLKGKAQTLSVGGVPQLSPMKGAAPKKLKN